MMPVTFFHFYLEKAMRKLDVISQERSKIKVKLLMSDKYNVIYAASIGTTTDDLE